MSANIDEILRAIRQDCRLAMNGVVSTSMREYGLDYKLNFGLINQQIKALADKYGQSKALAERLWTESTRELKILATLIYPIEEFTIDVANNWVKDIPNQEIREQVCFNLFQNLPYAKEVAEKWMRNVDGEIRISGYWLMTRLLLTKKSEIKLLVNDLGDYIWQDIISENIFLRKSSLSVLKHAVRQSEEQAKEILSKLEAYSESETALERGAYEEVKFEFEFIYL